MAVPKGLGAGVGPILAEKPDLSACRCTNAHGELSMAIIDTAVGVSGFTEPSHAWLASINSKISA